MSLENDGRLSDAFFEGGFGCDEMILFYFKSKI